MAALVSVFGICACAGEPSAGEEPRETSGEQARSLGEVKFNLKIGDEMIVGGVRYQITGNDIPALMGMMEEEGDGKTVSLTVSLPAGRGYNLIIAAYRVRGEQVCMLSTKFNVIAGTITNETLNLQCEDVEADDIDGGGPRGDGGARDATSGDAAWRASDAGVHDAGDLRGAEAGVDPRADADAAPALAEAGIDASSGEDAARGRSDATDGGATEPVDGGVNGTADESDGASAAVTDGAAQDGAAADSGVSECEVCSQRECAKPRGGDRMRDCYEAAGNAGSGPAQGIGKSVLCAAAVECAHRTSCGASNEQDCYCGAGMDVAMCVLMGPAGSCRVEFENAGQSTDPARVIASLSNSNTALFAAARLLECESQRCRSACFPSP